MKPAPTLGFSNLLAKIIFHLSDTFDLPPKSTVNKMTELREQSHRDGRFHHRHTLTAVCSVYREIGYARSFEGACHDYLLWSQMTRHTVSCFQIVDATQLVFFIAIVKTGSCIALCFIKFKYQLLPSRIAWIHFLRWSWNFAEDVIARFKPIQSNRGWLLLVR